MHFRNATVKMGGSFVTAVTAVPVGTADLNCCCSKTCTG